MKDWQMKEYNELRLEKINLEHGKYINQRLLYIVNTMFFENQVEEPELHGYSVQIAGIKEKGDQLEVEVEYICDYNGSPDSDTVLFPSKWLTMEPKEVFNEIVKYQIDKYNTKAEREEQARLLRKQKEISELEKKLESLKGGVK